MSDWSRSRAKARLDHREHLDELTARARYEVRLHLNEPAANTAYDDLAAIFSGGHAECVSLLAHRRLLPLWERLLLSRYAKRMYGKVTVGSVRDVPSGEEPWRVFGNEITALRPDSGDTGAKYDMQGRGLLTVFRIAVGQPGAVWQDRQEVATTSARNILTCSAAFLRRKPWHVIWPVYRVRGLRLWKL
ncbi:hypothetical protein AB5J62_39080 [Amycolatopsis sp. cg5]|uniref:hypothetical protein n=1 Tax=Amycolatopsis sp. cg5 TaxID=3238802 RepID=UPI0035236F9D